MKEIHGKLMLVRVSEGSGYRESTVLRCLHLYSFEAYDRLFALLIMSDTENGAESNLMVHHGGSSSSQQDSISALPSTFSVEQSSESTDLTSTFDRSCSSL